MDITKSENWHLVEDAIQNNNPTLLEPMLRMHAEIDWKPQHDNKNGKLIRLAVKNNSIPVLRYFAEHGVCFQHLDHSCPELRTDASIPTLDFLFAHGWDINWRTDHPFRQAPFMWYCYNDRGKIEWCLEHGTSLTTPSEAPYHTHILERVVVSGDIETFEFLRSKGAPLGRLTLHRAVVEALHSPSNAPNTGIEKQELSRARYNKHMAMVRYLVDFVGLDVDALDYPPDFKWGTSSAHGTPLGYVAGDGPMNRDLSDVTWFLLDRGADPAPALALANECVEYYGPFIQCVEAWKVSRGREKVELPEEKRVIERSCCVQ